ncbi:MAG: hypothetical protein LBE78_07040, partial [Burkholderiaceae bacterium]|nr:hypothetical protein [Burkholderiaceae bacterium]
RHAALQMLAIPLGIAALCALPGEQIHRFHLSTFWWNEVLGSTAVSKMKLGLRLRRARLPQLFHRHDHTVPYRFRPLSRGGAGMTRGYGNDER